MTEDAVLSEFNVGTKLTHSETLLPMCKSALDCAKISLDEIDVFAVSNGPGSFTGIRIGISTIKGIASALNKPCIPVSTLEGLAYNLLSASGIICCVMDARCSQVYNALFHMENGNSVRLTPDRAISINDLRDDLLNLNENIFLVGDGADLCYNEFKDSALSLSSVPPHLKLQRAASVGLVAVKAFSEGKACSAAELMPAYLRLPQAERERMMREQRL